MASDAKGWWDDHTETLRAWANGEEHNKRHSQADMLRGAADKIDAQAAKIAELEAAEWYRSLTPDQLAEVRFYADLESYQKRVESQSALLTRAVEAMKRVPHFHFGPDGFYHYSAINKYHAEDVCRLGGACAVTKLIEEIERNG